MAAEKWATLRSQWLGQELRDLREANGMFLRDAAEYLQRDPGTLSRFESGAYPIRRPDLLALLDLYGVSDGHRRESLLKLSQEVWQKGWWDGYADDTAGSLIDYVWLESRSIHIRTFDNVVILGLLQTEDYARTAIAAADFQSTQQQRDRWLELRMARQRILSADNPPRLSTIIDEAALRRSVGGRDCMQGQLRHLLSQAARPNIEVRVMPFTAGAHASPTGAFRILTMQNPYPEVACADTPKGTIYIESPDTDRFVRRYDELRKIALGPQESMEFISELARESM
jgi:transcriptional regulator with XRE-family HTH domain